MENNKKAVEERPQFVCIECVSDGVRVSGRNGFQVTVMMDKQNLSSSGAVQSEVTGGKSKHQALESMLGKSIRNHGMGAGAELKGMMV